MNVLFDKLDFIYSKVKELYPTYNVDPGHEFYGMDLNWNDPKNSYTPNTFMWNVRTDESNWDLELEYVLECEKNGKIFNSAIEPEVEIVFDSDEEIYCYVYTDKDGNIRSMFLGDVD